MANNSNLITAILLILVVIGIGGYTYHTQTSGYKNTLNYDFETLAFSNNETDINENKDFMINVTNGLTLENLTFADNVENKPFNISEVKDFKLTFELENFNSINDYFAYFTFDSNAIYTVGGGYDINGFKMYFNDNVVTDYINYYNIFGSVIYERNIIIGDKIKFEFTGNVEDDYLILRISDGEEINSIYATSLSTEYINGFSLDNFDFIIDGTANLNINSLTLEYN